MASGDSNLDTAFRYINRSQQIGGLGDNIVAGASAVVLAAFSIVINLGRTLSLLLTEPTRAFAQVTRIGILGIFGGPAKFLQSAWNTAAMALGVGPWTALGPFVIAAASASVVAGLVPIFWFLDQRDSDTLTGINLPFVNLDTGGTQADEND